MLLKDGLLQFSAVLQRSYRPRAADEECPRRLGPSCQRPPELGGQSKKQAAKRVSGPGRKKKAESPLLGGGGFPN